MRSAGGGQLREFLDLGMLLYVDYFYISCVQREMLPRNEVDKDSIHDCSVHVSHSLSVGIENSVETKINLGGADKKNKHKKVVISNKQLCF